jgi:hypothetical protein
MADVGKLLKKMTNPMAIMIIVVGLMTGCSDFCENFYDFSIFIEVASCGDLKGASSY